MKFNPHNPLLLCRELMSNCRQCAFPHQSPVSAGTATGPQPVESSGPHTALRSVSSSMSGGRYFNSGDGRGQANGVPSAIAEMILLIAMALEVSLPFNSLERCGA